MSLLSSLRTNAPGVFRKSVTSVAFSTDRGPGEQYLDHGYYGIYNAAYSGFSTALGAQVTDTRALSLTAVFACVKIISEDVASLPFGVFQKLTDGGDSQREAYDHPVYDRLKKAPNPDMTAIQFREALTAHALVSGSAYARIERSRSDSERIIALWPIMPYQIRRDQDSRGRVVFVDASNNSKTYQQRDIFQLHGFGVTGREGMNVLHQFRNAIGLGLAQEEYAGRFFSQDQTPNIVLSHPTQLGPEGVKGVKAAWAGIDPKTGQKIADQWHAPKVLQEGMKVEQLHPDADKSQITEQRAFQVLEACRIFRMAPHKLAELGRATWGNIGDLNRHYYTETLRSWLTRWEQSANHWLLGDDSGYFAEHEVEVLLRGSFKEQADHWSKLLEKGVLSINEVRALLNYNPVTGGDDHFIQLNLGTLQQVAQDETETQPDQGVQP